MSLSATIPTISSLLDREAKRLADSQKRHDTIVTLVEALPPGSPAPISVEDFGYCAQASIEFEASEDGAFSRHLLELYPPVEVVSILGPRTSQKPKKYLRGDELTTPHQSIYPVLAKQSPSHVSTRKDELCWWTQLAGRDVAITVKNGRKSALQLPDDRFELRKNAQGSSSSSTVEYYARRLKPIAGQPDALGAWHTRNSAFMDEQQYNALKRLFGTAVLSRAKSDKPLVTMADLPEPMYLRAGEAIAIPEGVDMSERLGQIAAWHAARKQHPLDRIGDFWRVFTKEDAEKLLAFSAQQAQCYAEAVAKSEEQSQEVKAWFEAFFSARPCVQLQYGLEYLAACIEQRCRAETGLAVKLVMYAVDSSARVSFSLQSGVEGGITVKGLRGATGPMLLAQDIEVEYA